MLSIWRAGLAVVILAYSLQTSAAWRMVTPYGTTNDLYDVASANGVFVAGGNNALLYSLNGGASWKPGEFTGTPSISRIVHGNGMFLAVGNGAYRSSDGKSWTAAAGGGSDLAFGNGIFVSVGGSIASSTDGANWTGTSFSSSHTPRWVSFANGRFAVVAIGTNIVIGTSTDAQNWNTYPFTVSPAPPDKYCDPRFPCPGYSVLGLAGGAGFLATVKYQIRPGGVLMEGRNYVRSGDGTTWAASGSAEGLAFSAGPDTVEFVNGQFMRVGDTSPDTFILAVAGSSTKYPLPRSAQSGFPLRVAGGGGLVVVGTKGYIAHGALGSMQLSTAGSPVPLASVAATGTRLVGVGPSLSTELSLDGGASWTVVPLPSGAGLLKSVEYADRKFVGVGTAGTVVRSSLGDAWSKRLSNTSSDLNDIVFGNGLWVAVGKAGTVISSADASFFDLQNPPTQVQLNGVGYGGGNFVAVGADGAILKSSNGLNWTVRGTEEAVSLNGVGYGNGRFVVVGDSGITHWSSDLTTWKTVRIEGGGRLARVAFGGGKFVAVEEGKNRVFESINGEAWTPMTLPNMANTGADASDGKVWVSGTGGVIWKWTNTQTLGVAGEMDAQGRFVLTIRTPTAGRYRIYSTNALGLALTTWTARDALDVEDELSWIETIGSAQSFYMVKQE